MVQFLQDKMVNQALYSALRTWFHSCNMCLRSLGFVLILFPGVLQAQGCDAPRLLHGNFLPKQQTYSDGTTITYACDNGYKPAVEGWWATSTCQHGTWSHEPQCIGESSCLPPTIPKAKYPENSNGWYEDGSTLRITCEAGFEHKNQNTTTTCGNGNWSPVPVCGRSADTSASNDSRPALRNRRLPAGPRTVTCYRNGSWSQMPTCEEAFCVMDPAKYAHYGVKPGQSEYIEDGKTQFFKCISMSKFIIAQCTNRRITLARCCSTFERMYFDYCFQFTEPT
ncbi:complement factor H-related protein 1-like isoform X2 [Archocentrus centrarchus]|uniref:complement factor H-related protein 1-like isoform X2 n=1 Tax=Archocentrus centrarchus TaxID=63155 RepID=UPI0011E9B399|nr:complement factor H-related protein 1-like isoform X2 [Archocentrus centrarchus]